MNQSNLKLIISKIARYLQTYSNEIDKEVNDFDLLEE